MSEKLLKYAIDNNFSKFKKRFNEKLRTSYKNKESIVKTYICKQIESGQNANCGKEIDV